MSGLLGGGSLNAGEGGIPLVAALLKGTGKHGEHVHPPLGLLLTRGLDEGDAVRRGDGQRELVARHLLCTAHLQHAVHVHHALRDGGRVVVQGVGQLSVVVQHKPSPLPTLGPVEWDGEVPVRSHEQVAAF